MLFQVFGIILALVALVVAIIVTLGGFKTRGHLQRALNMSLLLVRVPKEKLDKDTNQQQKPIQELIGIGEQLVSGFAALHKEGWNKLVYGEPYIALELAVHHIGEEIHFYMAIPQASESMIIKQIHSYYPNAEVIKTEDYNIFNSEGSHAGATLHYEKNPILPFRTYKNLESDPMNAVLTSMSKLETEGEGVAFQLMLRPSHRAKLKKIATRTAREMQSGYHFEQALYRAKHPPKETEKEKDPNFFNPATAKLPQVVTPADEEVIKAIADKANRQTFDTNLRVVTSAQSQVRADQIMGEMQTAFTQFGSPDMNGLIVNKLSGRSLSKLLYDFSFRLFNSKKAMFMSTEEITSLYHIPTAQTAAPKVNFLKSKTSEPPANLPKQGVSIGKNVYRGETREVYLTQEDRRRHLYIIGQTGTGKSSLMKRMIEQDLKNGHGLCVIEPHGDFAEHAMSVIPKERAKDVVYFNPADLERPLGLNILEFDPKHPEQKTLLINELLAIIDKLYNLKETGGPLFEKYFKNSCLLLMDDFQADPTNESKIPILADISRVLVDDAFRKDKLSRESDPLVRQFWNLEAEKAGGESALSNMAPYISSKIDTFVSSEFLRPIINQKKSSIDFRSIMDDKKILIVSLSKGRIGETNAQMLGMMVVTKLLASALSRVDIPEEERKDFYMYMDEFQNITTESIATILSEARKYRLSLTLAHQFIKQLQEPIRDAVFGNVGSIVGFRVGAEDAEYMKTLFEPEFSQQDLANIDNFNAHVRLLIDGKTSRPFNIETIKESVGNSELFDNIKELSRLTYGRPRDEIEREIREKFEAIS